MLNWYLAATVLVLACSLVVRQIWINARSPLLTFYLALATVPAAFFYLQGWYWHTNGREWLVGMAHILLGFVAGWNVLTPKERRHGLTISLYLAGLVAVGIWAAGPEYAALTPNEQVYWVTTVGAGVSAALAGFPGVYVWVGRERLKEGERDRWHCLVVLAGMTAAVVINGEWKGLHGEPEAYKAAKEWLWTVAWVKEVGMVGAWWCIFARKERAK